LLTLYLTELTAVIPCTVKGAFKVNAPPFRMEPSLAKYWNELLVRSTVASCDEPVDGLKLNAALVSWRVVD
jgi:hypothetical protein